MDNGNTEQNILPDDTTRHNSDTGVSNPNSISSVLDDKPTNEVTNENNVGDVKQSDGSGDNSGRERPRHLLADSAESDTLDGEPKKETEEEKELKELIAPFNRFPKLKKWTELFTDKNNKETYGNRTESAMQAYDCKDRVSAGVIGSQNFKKLRGIASIFAEDKGVTFEKMMDVALARAVSSENIVWWNTVMDMTGYRDLQTQTVINNNTQNNVQYNLNDDKVIDWNDSFKKFLESQ